MKDLLCNGVLSRARYNWLAACASIALCSAAACDVDVTGAGTESRLPAVVRVLDPSTPIVAMALSDAKETLWIEGDKEPESGRVRSLTRVVYRAQADGHDVSLRISFDGRGLPRAMEDERGNTLQFTAVDLTTGRVTVVLTDANGTRVSGPMEIQVGRDGLARVMAAFTAATDHLHDTECDQRDEPNLNLIDYSLQVAEIIGCVVALRFATPAAFPGVLAFCASTFIGLLTIAVPSDGLRILSFIVNSVSCPFSTNTLAGADACARTIFYTAVALLSAPCSFIGGTWAGSEYAVVTGSIDVGGVTTPVHEVIGPEDGTIVIDQQGCNVHWVVGGVAQRTGDVSGNNINVRGPAAQVLVGTVTNERVNHFAALGRVCGDLIHFEGDGRFAADIQTGNGSGTVDITVDSDAWLTYRRRFFDLVPDMSTDGASMPVVVFSVLGMFSRPSLVAVGAIDPR